MAESDNPLGDICEFVSEKLVSLRLKWYSIKTSLGFHDAGVYDI